MQLRTAPPFVFVRPFNYLSQKTILCQFVVNFASHLTSFAFYPTNKRRTSDNECWYEIVTRVNKGHLFRKRLIYSFQWLENHAIEVANVRFQTDTPFVFKTAESVIHIHFLTQCKIYSTLNLILFLIDWMQKNYVRKLNQRSYFARKDGSDWFIHRWR